MRKLIVAVLLLLHGLIASAETQTFTSGEFRYAVGEPPEWVKPIAAPPAGAPGAAGTDTLDLMDTQVLVEGKDVSRFQHLAYRVRNQAALDEASHIHIPFIPDYQQLCVHGVWLTRDGKRMARLDPTAIRIVSTEADLRRRIFRGVATASIFVKDVRIGDQVEVSFSIAGNNPVLGNHAQVLFPLAFEVPVRLLHARLLAPADQHYALQVFHSPVQPTVRSLGVYAEQSIELRDTPKQQPLTQSQAASRPFAQASGFRDWREVSRWGSDLFDWNASLPAELQARVEQWRQDHPDPSAAAVAALDYVQKELRYVSVSLGENALRPATPEKLLARGFGDCKDKSLLLVVILRALGMRALPALVSTQLEAAAFDVQPTAATFDHAIVMVEVDDQRYWLDPTNEYQYGPLAARSTTSFRKALLLGDVDEPVHSMTAPAGAPMAGFASTHRYVVEKFSEPVKLQISSSLSGVYADWLRARMANDQQAMEERYAGDMRRLFPSVERVGSLQMSNDERDGSLKLAFQYRIPEFFSYAKGELRGSVAPPGLYGLVNELESRERTTPIQVTYPLSASVDIVIEFPQPVPIPSGDPVSIRDDYIAYELTRKYEGSQLKLHHSFQSLADSVPADAIAAHNEVRKRIARWLSTPFSIATPSARDDAEAPAASGSTADQLIRESQLNERIRSRDIASGWLNDKQLSRAHLQRAWAWEHLARQDKALADARRATELDASNTDAMETVAADLRMLRRFDEAREAYAAAAAKVQDNFTLYMGRGQLHYYTDAVALAQADFRRAAGVAKGGELYYALIWLYMAGVKAGTDPKAEIGRLFEGERTEWPAAAVDLLLGKIPVDALYEAAHSADRKTDLLQLCEAHFFVGQYHLLRGEVDQARKAFESSIATNVIQYLEYEYSQWELRGLRAQP